MSGKSYRQTDASYGTCVLSRMGVARTRRKGGAQVSASAVEAREIDAPVADVEYQYAARDVYNSSDMPSLA